MRAHAIILSARRFSIDQIAAIYEIDRDRVSQWLEWWKELEFDGLADDARAGRPPKRLPQNKHKPWTLLKSICNMPSSRHYRHLERV